MILVYSFPFPHKHLPFLDFKIEGFYRGSSKVFPKLSLSFIECKVRLNKGRGKPYYLINQFVRSRFLLENRPLILDECSGSFNIIELTQIGDWDLFSCVDVVKDNPLFILTHQHHPIPDDPFNLHFFCRK